jgi:hypothetical protein
MLEVQHGRAWRNIVTLGDSWSSLTTDHEFFWLSQGEKGPERERHMIQSTEFLLTIVAIRTVSIESMSSKNGANSTPCIT